MSRASLRFVLVSAAKDLRRRLRDPAALAIWLGIPLLLGGLMSLVAGPGATPRARVLLVDQDDTFLTRLVERAGGGESPFEIEPVTLADGRARIEAGEASAMLVLPHGFSDALLREEPLELELVTNPAQTIAPRMVRETLDLVVEAVFYAHRLLGGELRELAQGPPGGADFFDDVYVAEVSARINRRMRALEGTLFPPVLELRFEEPAAEREEEPAGGLALLFLPGLVFMSLVFIGQGLSDDLWLERDQGTLRRALASPQGLAPFLLGKLGAGAAVMAAAALAGLLLGAGAFGLPFGALPAALLWCVFAGTSLLCLFLWLQLLASSQRAANVLSTAVVFPLVMLGGSFFPFEAMPGWMASAGAWTPNGRGVLALKALMHGELGEARLGLAFLVVALPGALALFLAIRRLRGRFLAR